MTLIGIGLMTVAALAVWIRARWRLTALLLISVIALFALQTERSTLAVALPVATVLLVIGVWWLVTPHRSPDDWRVMSLIAAITTAAALVRAVLLTDPSAILEAARVLPPLMAVGAVAVSVGALVPSTDEAARRRLALAFVILIIGLFIILKTPALHALVTGALIPAQAETASLWGWLGFSYIAFRLMHVLLDYRIGRLAPVKLRDFALYVIFFPALTAGPIARIEHFARELDTARRLDSARLLDGGVRIGIGLFKKFVIADTLALIALDPQLAAMTEAGPEVWWVMLYAYAFRIFFDFSGYVDIAIGIGRLAGIGLPENFAAPYLRRNITAFWNSWHITLATWFRTYFFTPLSRALMATPLRTRRLLVIFIAQVSTMILIGLWHGVAANFVLWGGWHGIGLWLHKWQSDRFRGWDAYVADRPALGRIIHAGSVIVTFHFVALGWVFFALDDPQLIARALAGLFGMG